MTMGLVEQLVFMCSITENFGIWSTISACWTCDIDLGSQFACWKPEHPLQTCFHDCLSVQWYIVPLFRTCNLQWRCQVCGSLAVTVQLVCMMSDAICQSCLYCSVCEVMAWLLLTHVCSTFAGWFIVCSYYYLMNRYQNFAPMRALTTVDWVPGRASDL